MTPSPTRLLRPWLSPPQTFIYPSYISAAMTKVIRDQGKVYDKLATAFEQRNAGLVFTAKTEDLAKVSVAVRPFVRYSTPMLMPSGLTTAGEQRRPVARGAEGVHRMADHGFDQDLLQVVPRGRGSSDLCERRARQDLDRGCGRIHSRSGESHGHSRSDERRS